MPIRNRFGRLLPDLGGARVLVVDDYPDTLYSMKRVLEYCGATVTPAASADEALKAVERDPPHVLVTDLRLPEHDGFWLLQQVRSLSPERRGGLPAVAMTAYPGQYVQSAAVSAGFQAFVAKPFDAEELCLTIAQLVRDLL
jgi:CheY-like chemotaxis protein